MLVSVFFIFIFYFLGIHHGMSHVLQMSSVLSDTYSEGGQSHRRIQAIPNTKNFMVSFGNAAPAIAESDEKVEDTSIPEHIEAHEVAVVYGNEAKLLMWLSPTINVSTLVFFPGLFTTD